MIKKGQQYKNIKLKHKGGLNLDNEMVGEIGSIVTVTHVGKKGLKFVDFQISSGQRHGKKVIGQYTVDTFLTYYEEV